MTTMSLPLRDVVQLHAALDAACKRLENEPADTALRLQLVCARSFVEAYLIHPSRLDVVVREAA